MRKQKTLLIVDDEDDLLYQFEMLFKSFNGIKLLTASDADKGLFLAQAEKPDVILMDYRMPEKDGESLLKGLRELLPNARFVMMTGWEDGLTRARIEQIGVDAYFEKPFELEKVLETLMRLLDDR